MSNKTKHLDYIQGIINRMADNSFKLKGWAASLATGLFALSAAVDERIAMISIAFIPVIVFWVLDGYFLWQERLFRGEYNRIRKLNEEQIDFEINPAKHIKGRNRWLATIFSKTLLVFYGMLLIVMLGILGWLMYVAPIQQSV